MTDRHSAIFAMMFAALIAYAISFVVGNQSFYERMKEVYLDG